MAENLAKQVDSQRRYEQGKRQALAWLKIGELELGDRYLNQDDVHERAACVR